MPPTPPTPTGYAVVTGAASGIGRAIADQLAAAGWTVARVDCTEAESPDAVRCDVAQQDDWLALEADLRQRWPRLDLLVNCAGMLVGGVLVDCPLEALTRVIDVNLRGTLLGCRVLGPWLIESGGLRPAGLRPRAGIVNVSSIFAAVTPPGFAAYNASKAGVLALSESLRPELAPHGLNVTVIAPGVVRTPLFKRSWFATDAFRDASGRFYDSAQLTPEQVAALALAAAAKGEAVAVLGGRAQRMWLLKRLCPGVLRLYVERRAAKELAGMTQPAAAGSNADAQRDAAGVG
ncbi:3-oxoacyl-[acyl-carrier-protein] reductase FabG [Posidoniimonas polymericola]|uniref:3-oxoacyl-[acyl-carrier-protein] reductase FabG n=1 Tax=Posidoniimonas polymericola TaxID=2528002 RepID=A0A5C5XQD5_9BACT|nr:SDR family oxidoreductase [Posidoniimonas polymericola]TWT65397.1 3-oxoacyl-[acyl-carrier-protein] reductase FabG [Posidoniimonas polymericola]